MAMPIAPNLSIRPHICAPWTTAWTLEHGVAEDHGHALRRGVRRLRGERRARQVLVRARKSKAGKRHRAPAFAIPDTQPGGTADDPQNLPPRTAQITWCACTFVLGGLWLALAATVLIVATGENPYTILGTGHSP